MSQIFHKIWAQKSEIWNMKLGCLRESNCDSGIIDILLLYCCPELYSYRICLKKLYSAKGKWNWLILSYIKGWLILNLLLSAYIVFFGKTTKWYHFTSFYVKSNLFHRKYKDISASAVNYKTSFPAKGVSLPNEFPRQTCFPVKRVSLR